MGAEYLRSTQVGVAVEVTPSLQVTRWDVLPAELPHQCYVVLDLLNCAAHEMDLHYTPTKHILIEAGDSCRVPVPVDRCPLATLTEVRGSCCFTLTDKSQNSKPSQAYSLNV